MVRQVRYARIDVVLELSTLAPATSDVQITIPEKLLFHATMMAWLFLLWALDESYIHKLPPPCYIRKFPPVVVTL